MDLRLPGPVELSKAGERLLALVEAAVASLRDVEAQSLEVEEFLQVNQASCQELKDRLDATTVAQVGLRAILTTYQARYGSQAEKIEDVVRFRDLLAEKEARLAGLEADLLAQSQRVLEFGQDLDRRRGKMDDSLDKLEAALAQVRSIRLAGLERLAVDKARVQSFHARFWPAEGRAGPGPGLNLPAEALQVVVGQVLARMAPDQAGRDELLRQALAAIKDDDLRHVLLNKLDLEPLPPAEAAEPTWD